MRETGWDYWTYCAQPQWVIDQLLMFLTSESQGQADLQRQQEARMKAAAGR